METTVNVMMFGGRRCGKTSVIAAMKRCADESFGIDSKLTISSANDETMWDIEEKENEIKAYFNYPSNAVRVKISDIATSDSMDFHFNVKLKSKTTGGMELSFYDYPGEWLDRRDKVQELRERMEKCNIIMIAIDTPYLMTSPNPNDDSVGRYNDYRNYCSRIAEMVKNNFTPSSYGPRMILLVPLKCEKYYNLQQMDEVNARVKAAYKNLLNYTGGDNYKNYEVVIAPILTLGEKTIEFARFESDENGDLIMDEQHRYPIRQVYNYVSNNAKYSPKYCEQPLLYTLAYILYLAKENLVKEKARGSIFSNIIRYFQEVFGGLAGVKDFMNHEREIYKAIKTSGDGYEIIQNPLKIR